MTERTKAEYAALRTVTTPKFRVSFPSVFEPNVYKDQKPKYQLACLFDETTDLTPLKKAVFFVEILLLIIV